VEIVAVLVYHLTDTIESVTDQLGDSVLVSSAVGAQRDQNGLEYNPSGVDSVTAFAANDSRNGIPVVDALHNFTAGRPGSPNKELNWDIPVVTNNNRAKETITILISEIDGLRLLNADEYNHKDIRNSRPKCKTSQRGDWRGRGDRVRELSLLN